MQFNDIYTEWNGHCTHSTARSNARGVSILFNKKLDYTIHRQLCDENGNFVLIDLSVSKNRFTLAAAYFPNSDKPTFIEHLFSAIDSFDNNSYMLCGDFNLVLDPEIDYYNYKTVGNKNVRLKLLQYIEDRQFVDPYRELYPDSKRFTWRRTNPLQQARLDFYLTTSDLSTYIYDTNIGLSYNSDHSPVLLYFKFEDNEHG